MCVCVSQTSGLRSLAAVCVKYIRYDDQGPSEALNSKTFVSQSVYSLTQSMKKASWVLWTVTADVRSVENFNKTTHTHTVLMWVRHNYPPSLTHPQTPAAVSVPTPSEQFCFTTMGISVLSHPSAPDPFNDPPN